MASDGENKRKKKITQTYILTNSDTILNNTKYTKKKISLTFKGTNSFLLLFLQKMLIPLFTSDQKTKVPYISH